MGLVASIPLIFYFHVHPLKLGGEAAKTYQRFGFEAIFPTSLNIEHFINQGINVLCIGLLLSFYPIYKVIRLNPIEAMRK